MKYLKLIKLTWLLFFSVPLWASDNKRKYVFETPKKNSFLSSIDSKYEITPRESKDRYKRYLKELYKLQYLNHYETCKFITNFYYRYETDDTISPMVKRLLKEKIQELIPDSLSIIEEYKRLDPNGLDEIAEYIPTENTSINFLTLSENRLFQTPPPPPFKS